MPAWGNFLPRGPNDVSNSGPGQPSEPNNLGDPSVEGNGAASGSGSGRRLSLRQRATRSRGRSSAAEHHGGDVENPASAFGIGVGIGVGVGAGIGSSTSQASEAGPSTSSGSGSNSPPRARASIHDSDQTSRRAPSASRVPQLVHSHAHPYPNPPQTDNLHEKLLYFLRAQTYTSGGVHTPHIRMRTIQRVIMTLVAEPNWQRFLLGPGGTSVLPAVNEPQNFVWTDEYGIERTWCLSDLQRTVDEDLVADGGEPLRKQRAGRVCGKVLNKNERTYTCK